MASGAYKNGTPKGPLKFDRPLSVNSSSRPSMPSKSPPAALASGLRRSSPASLSSAIGKYDYGVSGRVRVAVRLRPRNAEELVADADFADCIELQPEIKRLKLHKNNWDSDTYQFDEVLTEFASQKRVYEVVAKPVVESVPKGYNGTVMAYGQTGTGKTLTLGHLGEENTADCGIMVRSMEDILADISPEIDSVSVSYLQLYMESIQDLLDPPNDNISMVEDPKTGDVSVRGTTPVEIRDQRSFVDLLRFGEAHRYAANTKLNTESSRSHAILMVHVRRSAKGRHDREGAFPNENDNASFLLKAKGLQPPIVRKSKLVVVDLAGSERIDKSGTKTGRSLLIDDRALPWIVQNANSEASVIRWHVELALCHLAQHEVNAKDMVSVGALWELVRISHDCSREDIRTLAHQTLTSSPTFQVELRRLRIEC